LRQNVENKTLEERATLSLRGDTCLQAGAQVKKTINYQCAK